MARSTYGGGASDVIVTPTTVSSTLVAGIPAGQSFQVWNLANTTLLTGIQDSAGVALAGNLVVSDANGQIPQFRGPDNYRGPLRLKHPSTSQSWILRPNTSEAGPNVITVASSTSTYNADFRCDGTADQAEIQAALDQAKALGGGTVQLTSGVFNLAAGLVIDGSDDPDVSKMVKLFGAGNYSTTLNCATGIHAVTMSHIARTHIADLGIKVLGAGDGIRMITIDDDTYWRSSDECVLERLYITGQYSAHTGWAMNLGSPFRSSVRDIHIEGVKGGIRLFAENAEQNPGDCTFDRMMVGVSEANGVAYQIESPTSSLNQMLFTTAHCFADPAKAGTIGWNLSGAYGSNHIKTMNCNAEQFGTLVAMSAGQDADMRFVHVTAKNGSTVFSTTSSTYWNRFEVGELYVEPAATVTVINDAGATAGKPNRYLIQGYVETGATCNATLGPTAMLEAGAYSGPGTVAAALRCSLPGLVTRPFTLTDGTTITIDASRGSAHRVTLAGSRTMAAPLNPTDGQRLIISVIQDATGSRTLTWNAVFAFGTTVTNALTATAGKRDIIEFMYDLVANKWYAVSASKNL